MKKTTFFDAADPAPERIVRNLASEYVKVKTKVNVFKKTIACTGMKRPASDLLEDPHPDRKWSQL
jgi:hypothetical protein